MLEIGRGLDLGQEALSPEHGGQLRLHDLDRYLPLVPHVIGKVDGSHATLAELGAERFLAEIKTTANLQHPHILPLFDSGEANGFLFYVTPYVDG